MKYDVKTGVVTYEKYDIGWVAIADRLIGPDIRLERCVIMDSGSCRSEDQETTMVKVKLDTTAGEICEVPLARIGADPDDPRQRIIDLMS